MNLIEKLNWRYATKKMNGTLVPEEKVEAIIEATRLTASSSGLQPYQIISISGKEWIDKVIPTTMGNNQNLLANASHILVFAAWDKYTEERLNIAFNRTIAERGMPADAFDAYKQMIWGMYSQQTPEENFNHTARQAYIALGTALIAAADLKVDATPIEGFNPKALDEVLNLSAKGLRSCVILALGYRDAENDWLAPMKKVRTPKNEFTTHLN